MDGFQRPAHEDVLANLIRELHDGDADCAIPNDTHLLTLLKVYVRAKPGGEVTHRFKSAEELAAFDVEKHPFCSVLDDLDFHYRVKIVYEVTDEYGFVNIQYAADPENLNLLTAGVNLPKNFRRGRFFGYPMSAIAAHFSQLANWADYKEMFPKLIEKNAMTPEELAIQITYVQFVPELTEGGIREATDVAFQNRSRVRRFIEFTGLTMAHEILDELEDEALEEVEYLIDK
jgi:hypothetical protein